MEREKFVALVAFVEDNPCGLATIRKQELARRVLQHLLEGKMDALNLFLRAKSSRFRDEFFADITTALKTAGRTEEWARAIVMSPADWWGEEGFDPDDVCMYLDDAELFEMVVNKRRELLNDPDHFLFHVLKPDAYWMKRVRWYIASRDYPRAWDELKKALRGFRVSRLAACAQRSGDRRYRWNQKFQPLEEEHGHGFWASEEVLKRLVTELFAAMVGAGLVNQIPDGTYTIDGGYTKMEVYETKPCSHHKPRAYEQTTMPAGFAFASLFRAEMPTSHYLWRSARPIAFQREGGMVLSIAEYFRQKGNERKRRKHQQLLAEYEAQQQ